MSEEHHEVHPVSHYWKIYWILMVLFLVSVMGPVVAENLDNKTIARVLVMITAFGIAIVKAFLVCKNFMHLNVQKKYVLYMLAMMLAFVALFFAGTAPDVMKHEGRNWENYSAKEAVERGLEMPHGHDDHGDDGHDGGDAGGH